MSIISNRQIIKTVPEINIVPTDSSQFESSIGLWNTYVNAASTQPVDGTGGFASITLSRTVVSAEVLNGSASLKLAKDAANRQGEGASLDLTVPNYLKGQPCRVSFSAKASANFDFGTPMSSNDPSDITVYLYDVTNSKLLQPFPYTIDSNLGYEGYFQIPSDCADLRLILHISTTNAAAYDLFIDDVVIEEAPNQNVSTDSDWQAYTPTFTGFGTVTSISAYYRKNGNNVEIKCKATAGTPTATEARISLPAGLVTSSIISTLEKVGSLDRATGFAAGYFYPTVLVEPSLTYVTFGAQGSGTAALVKRNGNEILTTSEPFSLIASIPIQGWTSGQVTAASANLNAPAVFYGTQSSEAVTGGTTNITFTSSKDTVLGWSTNIYTVKVPGDYQVSYSLTSSAASTMAIYKNNTLFNFGSFASAATSNGVGSLLLTDLVVGDTISVRSQSSVTVTNGKLTIARISTSSGVYKTRVAYIKDVKSSGTAGGTFTSGSYQTRTLNTLEGDQSFVSLSSNQFTLQPGTYQIEASAPAFAVSQHKAKLRNITDSTDTIVGTAEYANTVSGHSICSLVAGTFSITSTKIFEIQHRAAATRATNGFGEGSSFGDSEVYTVVKIEKVL